MAESQIAYSKPTILFELLIGLRLVMSLCPAASEFFPFVVNIIVVLAIWTMLFSLVDRSFIFKKIGQFCPLYLIAFVNILFGYRSTTVPLFVYGMLQWFMMPVVISYLVEYNQKRTIIRLLLLSLICIVITSITTYLGNEAIPGASRALAAIWNDDVEQAHILRRMNIGGFEFTYLLSLLVPLLVYVIKSETSKLFSIIAAGAIALFFITIIKTEYTTALVLAFLSLALIFLPKHFSQKQLVVFLIAGIIFLFVGTEIIIGITNHLSDTTESGVISERLAGISDILSGNQTSGDTESRQVLMKISWQSFLENPLTGSKKVGGHSYILDNMGHFGIWGILLLYIVFHTLFKLFVKPYKSTNVYGLFLYVYIAQIFLCIVNTAIIETIFFVFLPMMAYWCNLTEDNI